MVLPNFIIGGVQKAGTTSLHAYLNQHPDIFLVPSKELNFFNMNWSRGVSWYQKNFEGWSGESAIGEASPLYLWERKVPERMALVLPDVKLIFLLRNPIDRAYSNYWFNVARGTQNPKETFSQAIRSPAGQWRYLSKGLYAQQLKRYEKYFPRTKRLILFTEELQRDPQKVLRKCFLYVGVDGEFDVKVLTRHNVTHTPRGPIATEIWCHWVMCKESMRNKIPKPIGKWVRHIRKGLHEILFVQKPPEPMSEADRKYLKSWYEDEMKELSVMLDEMPCWIKEFGVKLGS